VAAKTFTVELERVAKRAETRARRIAATVDRVASGVPRR
jgi:hypothetical protein